MPWFSSLIVILCVLSPFLVMYPLSRITGWSRLAARYPWRPAGETHASGRSASIVFGVVGGYNNCIVWSVDDDHLHLRMWRIFSLGHQPMSIPLAELEFTREIRGGGYVQMRLGDWRLTTPRAMVAREMEIRQAIETDVEP